MKGRVLPTTMAQATAGKFFHTSFSLTVGSGQGVLRLLLIFNASVNSCWFIDLLM